MQTKSTYRFIALTMAFLLLFSSSGLTMDMHFCQNQLKRINVFGKAKTCAEVTACMKKCGIKAQTCHSATQSCGADGEHKDCCHNESFTLDMDFDHVGIAYATLVDSDQNLNLLPSIGFTGSQIVIPYHHIPFHQYKPPLLTRDIPVLVQSFLL